MTDETKLPIQSEDKGKRSTVDRMTSVLEDTVDIIGLGLRVVRNVRDLTANPERGQQLRKEAKDRAKKIRADRKKGG